MSPVHPVAEWLAAARALTADPADGPALAWLAGAPALPATPAPAAPRDLSALPADLPPAAWHARRLIALATKDACDPVERAYHARWLWHLLAPEDPAGWPLISVVIPVFNRHELMQEAVASVLANDYPRLEICVCDDGSDSDPLPLLQSLGPRLRYRRLARNAGVAVARQTALELARGELVQFLDTDDLLLPTALVDKVAALAAVPDAELCFSRLEQIAFDLAPGRQPRRGRAVGGPDCPSLAGPLAMVHLLPFLPSALLVARHRMLARGFVQDWRLHEDRLAFGRLGLAGIKSVALTEPRTVRRWLPSSASRTLRDDDNQQARALMTLLAETLAQPAAWPVAGQLCFALFDADWGRLLAKRQAAHEAQLEALLCQLAALALAPPGGLAVKPLLAVLQGGLRRALRDQADDKGYGAATLARLELLAEGLPDPGPADLALWSGAPDPAEVAGALRLLFPALSAALCRGEAWVPLATLDQPPFRSIPHPAKRRWKLLATLARGLGDGPARLLARLLG